MKSFDALLYKSKDSSEYIALALRELGRGAKTQFAEALRIQPAYLSQILSRKFFINLEQADLCNLFFKHDHQASDYFLNLVGRDRAGTASLARYYNQKLNDTLMARNEVIHRLGRTEQLTEENRGIYYSSWIYSAVHIACTIPKLRTRNSISDYLGLPLAKVAEALDFLHQAGILEKKGLHYHPTKTWLRLERTSPHITAHNSQWRQKAIQNLDISRDEDLHFSGVYSIDGRAAAELKEAFLEVLQKNLKVIHEAAEEDLYVIGLDLFKLRKTK